MHLSSPGPYFAGKILNWLAIIDQLHYRAQIRNINEIKEFFMKSSLILSAALCLVLCALAAGCISPMQADIKPVETTTAPTPLPTTSTSVATVVSTPVAVETLPAEQFVDVQVYKQRPDATIHLVYNGGKGAIFVQNIMMRVNRSDGTTEEKYLNDGNRKPRQGDELVMDGSRGPDRIVVFLTSAGTTYKIYDESLALPYY